MDTLAGSCCGSPYPATFEHSRVDQVRAHQGHVDAVLLWGFNLVAQGLVKPNGTELAGTVILSRIKRKQIWPVNKKKKKKCT